MCDAICRALASTVGGGGAEETRDVDVEGMTVGELKEKLKELGFKVLIFALHGVCV